MNKVHFCQSIPLPTNRSESFQAPSNHETLNEPKDILWVHQLVVFTCLMLHFLIATKFFINTYLNYQTLVLFLVAKTSADNLSQGFRTELPLTYRLPSPRPPLPISFSLLTTSTSLLLSPYTPRRSKKTVLVQVLLFCLRVEIN